MFLIAQPSSGQKLSILLEGKFVKNQHYWPKYKHRVLVWCSPLLEIDSPSRNPCQQIITTMVNNIFSKRWFFWWRLFQIQLAIPFGIWNHHLKRFWACQHPDAAERSLCLDEFDSIWCGIHADFILIPKTKKNSNNLSENIVFFREY